MRIPSTKTIGFYLGPELRKDGHEPKDIRKTLEEAEEAGTYEAIDSALDKCNSLLGGYGVEPIRDTDFRGYYCDIGLLYVNMGDTYASTIVYDTRKGNFFVCSWGDIVERQEKRFNV